MSWPTVESVRTNHHIFTEYKDIGILIIHYKEFMNSQFTLGTSYTPTSFCPPPHIFTMYNNSIISRSVFLSPHSTDSLNSTAVTINKTEYPHKIENRLYQGSTGLYQGSTGLYQGTTGLYQGSTGLYQGSTGLYQGLTGLYHGIGLGTEFCIELLEVFV